MTAKQTKTFPSGAHEMRVEVLCSPQDVSSLSSTTVRAALSAKLSKRISHNSLYFIRW